MTPYEPSDPPRHPPKPSSSTTLWTTPANTDVIWYEYLWRSESARGLEDGRKIRPCLVVATFEAKGALRVITAPFTTRDYAPETTVRVPPAVARHLRLDERTRIVWTDLNEFRWVSTDVRAGADGTPYLGKVPERLWRSVLDKVVAGSVRPVLRTD